jgi:hypothetical protein
LAGGPYAGMIIFSRPVLIFRVLPWHRLPVRRCPAPGAGGCLRCALLPGLAASFLALAAGAGRVAGASLRGVHLGRDSGCHREMALRRVVGSWAVHSMTRRRAGSAGLIFSDLPCIPMRCSINHDNRTVSCGPSGTRVGEARNPFGSGARLAAGVSPHRDRVLGDSSSGRRRRDGTIMFV